jgi:hypothetical protein
MGALDLADRLLNVRRVVLAVAEGEPVNLLVRSIQDNVLDGTKAGDESVANRDAVEDKVGCGVEVVVAGAQRLDIHQVAMGGDDFIHEGAKVGFSELDCAEETCTRIGARAKFLKRNLLQLLRDGLHSLDDLKGVGVNHGAWMLGCLDAGCYFVSPTFRWLLSNRSQPSIFYFYFFNKKIFLAPREK